MRLAVHCMGSPQGCDTQPGSRASQHQAGVEPRMDARVEFLNRVREGGLDRGHFLGLLHTLIGRRIETADGKPVSAGNTWRDVAALLKKVRWAREAVAELNLSSDDLPQRDRERYWYSAITQAHVDTPEATKAGDALVEPLAGIGYVVGPAPGTKKS